MPSLKRIVIQDFRNIRLQEIAFSPNVNCISGGNGEGKTNLMDAIWYLSMAKSAFAAGDRFNFRHGTDAFSLAGVYAMPSGPDARFSISVDAAGEKKIRRDDKPYPKVSAHIGELPVVMVSPSDISLVSESGEDRRRFANAVLSQLDRAYLAAVQQYNRLLAQRNRLLKAEGADLSLLDVFDLRMEACADVIHAARKRFTEQLQPLVAQSYDALSGGGEQVSVEYRSDGEKGPLSAVLAACRDRDRALRYTTAGVHRDDFLFRMDGYPIRHCGSQGQQKSFLVALKFAQYEIMKKEYGYPPMLLLDDVFDKLDMDRISNLLGLVAGSDYGQIFITDSNKVRMAGIVDRITPERAYFVASGGEFKPL